MPIVYKVLNQVNPAATTLSTLYTVPSSTSAIVSTLTVANLSSTQVTYRIAVRPAGAAIDNKHYLVYDAILSGNTTTALTLGITLATTDVISVYASSTNVSFSAFGSEIS